MSLNPGEYNIMNMPFDYLTSGCKVTPDIDRYVIKSGQSISFLAQPIKGWQFDHWDLRDFSTYLAQQAVSSPWQMPGGINAYLELGVKHVTANPITITAGGVDESHYNETYRTWWLNAVFISYTNIYAYFKYA
jgi:hypothetical protein